MISIIDEDLVNVLNTIKKFEATTLDSLYKKLKVPRRKLEKIVKFLYKYNMVKIKQLEKSNIIVKTEYLDDFYEFLINLKSSVENKVKNKITKYKAPSITPEIVENVEEIMYSLSKSDMTILLKTYEYGMVTPVFIQKLSSLSRSAIAHSMAKLVRYGLIKVIGTKKIKVIELTPKGLFVAQQLVEISRAIG